VTAGEDAPLRGTCAFFARRHVVELHELTRDEAAAYVHDLQRVARAVQTLTGAPKLNYEVHGNTIAHLHTHIFPRYHGDPFQGGPIDPRRAVGPVYAPGEFAAFAGALREAVEAPAG
jgi:diadenosine tetraphosphate (Ap4A) HIT family hydrolase